MTKPTVFISYSHKDEAWKDRLQPHIMMLQREGHLEVWEDRQIGHGAEWYDQIKEVMEKADVAICLISPHYLASRFCVKEEIPYLLERRKSEGMLLIPVLLRPCAWKAISWLSPLQMMPRDGKSITINYTRTYDGVFAELAQSVVDFLKTRDAGPFAPPPPVWAPPEKIDVQRMPATGVELFGRQKELELLDKAWEDPGLNVVSLVAWGGVGKTTLVNKWLERVAADNYRGARRVYAWSFYSQGTGERVTSADLFISQALAWFGDPEPTEGSPWDKGQRLAGLVRKEKPLLLLDGMEPLQSYLEYERGKVKDPALATLLAELARDNPGLVVVTTREEVADLGAYPETTRQRDLEQISAKAGRALLRVGGVMGTDDELEEATRAFGRHALALNLLAAYLRDVPGHPIARAYDIPDLDVLEAAGKQPRRVMAAFADQFGEGPEVEVLWMLGLFDRPADGDEIAALRAEPPIPGLTEHLMGLREAEWLPLLETLRRCGPPPTRHPGRPSPGARALREGTAGCARQRMARGPQPSLRASQGHRQRIPRHAGGDGPALRGGCPRLPGRPPPGGSVGCVLPADWKR
jgi:hypothetical protein